MDPLSHAAFGSTLIGAVTSNQLEPARCAACVVAAALGSLAPDLDAALMPFGWDRYLRAHEVGTHTIVGTLACAPVTAAAVRFFSRPGSYWRLTLSAWIGAASHVLLDLVSGARLRPGWPLIDTAVSVPLVAMADPWLLALLRRRTGRASGSGGSRGRRAARAALVGDGRLSPRKGGARTHRVLELHGRERSIRRKSFWRARSKPNGRA